ncbi:sporulation protein [Brevibacillus daliensis]|uniref:sporulation protein n=1 Tax=Brevibacillus daliensis TaxID=2892995 RepID=UPI001E602467|nr:sporulation protein [Brevibacillus daliensis]
MSIFKKMLASVGVGSASVDTRLYHDSFIPGDMAGGEVVVVGGDIEQEVDEIYIYVVTHYERESNDKKIKEESILLKYRVTAKFIIGPKEQKVFPFTFQLPYNTPLTIGRQPVYLRTGLDIKNAIDPGDSDYIEVGAHPLVGKVLDAIKSLGFQLYKVDCEYNPRLGAPLQFVQEFEYRSNQKYRRELEELEVVFSLREDELDIYLELDKRARGLFGALMEAADLNDRYVRITLHKQDKQRTNSEIMQLIENAIDNAIDNALRRR